MKKQIYLMIALAFILSIALVSSAQPTLGTFKSGDCIALKQICANCSFNNISSVIYPDSTQALGQASMDKSGTEYNYTFCDTNKSGTYQVNGYGDPAGVIKVWNYNFIVNANGGAEPNGIVTIFFILFLLFILAGLLFTIFNSLARVAYKEFYLVDVIISIGLYLIVVIYNYLSTIYFPNELVAKIMMVLMKVGVWTHVFIPLVAFFIVLALNYRTYGNEKGNSDNYAPMNANMDYSQRRNNRTYEPKFYRK